MDTSKKYFLTEAPTTEVEIGMLGTRQGIDLGVKVNVIGGTVVVEVKMSNEYTNQSYWSAHTFDCGVEAGGAPDPDPEGGE